MTHQAPIEVTNLDRYGAAALPWIRCHVQYVRYDRSGGATAAYQAPRPHSSGMPVRSAHTTTVYTQRPSMGLLLLLTHHMQLPQPAVQWHRA